jgi:hypothetical protein
VSESFTEGIPFSVFPRSHLRFQFDRIQRLDLALAVATVRIVIVVVIVVVVVERLLLVVVVVLHSAHGCLGRAHAERVPRQPERDFAFGAVRRR